VPKEEKHQSVAHMQEITGSIQNVDQRAVITKMPKLTKPLQRPAAS
jgi:hypothetical protein